MTRGPFPIPENAHGLEYFPDAVEVGLASSARSHWQPTGIGLAQADIFDAIGPVATAQQTLLLRRSSLGA